MQMHLYIHGTIIGTNHTHPKVIPMVPCLRITVQAQDAEVLGKSLENHRENMGHALKKWRFEIGICLRFCSIATLDFRRAHRVVNNIEQTRSSSCFMFPMEPDYSLH